MLFLRYLQLSLNISWNHFFSLKLRKKLRCKFMLLRSIMGIAQIFTTPLSRIFQKRLEHKNQTKYYRRMTRKPQSHFKILIYRTRVVIYKGLYCTHVISSVSQGGSIETLLSLGMFGLRAEQTGISFISVSRRVAGVLEGVFVLKLKAKCGPSTVRKKRKNLGQKYKYLKTRFISRLELKKAL